MKETINFKKTKKNIEEQNQQPAHSKKKTRWPPTIM